MTRNSYRMWNVYYFTHKWPHADLMRASTSVWVFVVSRGPHVQRDMWRWWLLEEIFSPREREDFFPPRTIIYSTTCIFDNLFVVCVFYDNIIVHEWIVCCGQRDNLPLVRVDVLNSMDFDQLTLLEVISSIAILRSLMWSKYSHPKSCLTGRL